MYDSNPYATPATFLQKLAAAQSPLKQYGGNPYLQQKAQAQAAFKPPGAIPFGIGASTPSTAIVGQGQDLPAAPFFQAPANAKPGPTALTTQAPVDMNGGLDTTYKSATSDRSKGLDAALATQAGHQAPTIDDAQYNAPARPKENYGRSIIDLIGAIKSPRMAPYIGRNITARKEQEQTDYQNATQAAEARYKVDESKQAAAERNEARTQAQLESNVKVAGQQLDQSQRRDADNVKQVQAHAVAQQIADARKERWIHQSLTDDQSAANKKWYDEALIGVDDRKNANSLAIASGSWANRLATTSMNVDARFKLQQSKAGLDVLLANAKYGQEHSLAAEKFGYSQSLQSIRQLQSTYESALKRAAVPGAPQADVEAAAALVKPGGAYEQLVQKLHGTALPGMMLPPSIATPDVEKVQADAYQTEYARPAAVAGQLDPNSIMAMIAAQQRGGAAAPDNTPAILAAINANHGGGSQQPIYVNGGGGGGGITMEQLQAFMKGNPQQQHGYQSTAAETALHILHSDFKGKSPDEAWPKIEAALRAGNATDEQIADAKSSVYLNRSSPSKPVEVTPFPPIDWHKDAQAFIADQYGKGANPASVQNAVLQQFGPQIEKSGGLRHAGLDFTRHLGPTAPVQHWNTPQQRNSNTGPADFVDKTFSGNPSSIPAPGTGALAGELPGHVSTPNQQAELLRAKNLPAGPARENYIKALPAADQQVIRQHFVGA